MLNTGDLLDRYEMIGELGAGAFGVVYRGRHLDMGREDAIKVPHNAQLARQFVTEGRLVARLDHPNVVRVYAMNMQHDPPYIVYELVEGQSLRDRMDDVGGPMDCDEVVEIARQVLEGLAAAHELGIIHRDLKPANILLRSDGVAKVADFGLGVAAEQMSMLASRSMSMGGEALASQLGISREMGSDVGSSVAGTFAYMSPEQEDGLELDGRSDLYALGVLMYEAVTGTRPRGRFKDPVAVNAAVGECLNDAIIAALETGREDRHADAGEMVAAMTRTAQAPPRVVEPPHRWRIEFPFTSPPPPEVKPWEPRRSSISPMAAPRVEEAPSSVVEPPPDLKPRKRPGERLGQEVVGPAGIPLVWVPGGSFMMGNTNEDVEHAVSQLGADRKWLDHEKPAHRVEMSGFWIGKTEITVAQWRSVMGSVPRASDQRGDDHPVVYVSWNACRDFCEKAGLKLPTEAQWEYAARGPEARRLPWGDEWDEDRLCWMQNPGPGGRTFPVGSFPSGASWCGALDMSGNVWEWCADWWGSDYYASSPATDPTGPTSGEYRVLRGGSWLNFAFDCRAAYRYNYTPGNTYNNAGFRVARSCR